MKKLLILGGSRYIIPVIKCAQNLGVFVITCDYLPDNIAHKYSNKYANISIVDKDKVLDFAIKEQINGIMSFACDPGVVTAAYVAEKMNLPAPGPYESVCILQDKGLFRKFLQSNNFNVPKSNYYSSLNDAFLEINKFCLPIIIKPVDSAGSKGVSKVTRKEDFSKAFYNAQKYSQSGKVIVEEFIEKLNDSSDCDWFSIDGNVVLSTFSSQCFDNDSNNPFTPALYCWPDTLSNENKNKLILEIQRLLGLLHMSTSLYNVEVRESKDGIPYIMEVSPRGGGNRLSEMVKLVYGVNLIENYVRSVLNLPLIGFEQNITNKYYIEVILHSNTEGFFNCIKINEKIENKCIDKDIWVQKGDYISAFNGANNTFGTLIFCFDDKDEATYFKTNYKKLIEISLLK